MTHAEKLDAMFEFELAVNKFTKLLKEHEMECLSRNDRDWMSAHIAAGLAEQLTYTKLAISNMLSQSLKEAVK